jgi:predicted SAM-dependent methyltransferase
MEIADSWSQFYETRKVIRKNFPDFWKIKIIEKPVLAIRQFMKEGDKVLDVGSFDRGLHGRLKEYYKRFEYKSMDVDRRMQHDYYSVEGIKEKFDIVFLFEVIEHMDLKEGVKMLENIHGILKPKGKVMLTTPNVFHPNRYWESSHKVSYRYDEIGGVLDFVGFNVIEIYRIYNDAFLKKLFRIHLASWIHEYLDVDFAKSILLVGEKKA